MIITCDLQLVQLSVLKLILSVRILKYDHADSIFQGYGHEITFYRYLPCLYYFGINEMYKVSINYIVSVRIDRVLVDNNRIMWVVHTLHSLQVYIPYIIFT